MPLRASTHGYAYMSSLSAHPGDEHDSLSRTLTGCPHPVLSAPFCTPAQDGKSLFSHPFSPLVWLAQQLKSSGVRYTACTA